MSFNRSVQMNVNQQPSRPTILELILARVTWSALIGLPCGLLIAWLHAPNGMSVASTWQLVCWGLCLGMILGAGAGLVSGTVASICRRLIRPSVSTTVAALAETLVFTLLFSWLLLNEAMNALTYEVFGWDSFLLLFYNPQAVLEASWEMAGRYVIGFSGVCLAMAVGFYVIFKRLHSPKTAGMRAPLNYLLHGGVGTVITVAVMTFVWQFQVRPSSALATLSRSAPVLRALNLPRALLGDELLTDTKDFHWARPIVSDEQFAERLPTPARKKHIVLMILESVPAKALGCYGRDREVTPNIDALAARGMRFGHCVAASSFSSYSLVSILTSLYMLRAERNDHFRNTDFPFCSLPRLLRSAGYQTALFSSGNESFENINAFYPRTEFDHYFSHDTCSIPKWDSMRMDDRHVTEAFERWIEQRSDDRPLFCLFNLQSTHFNYQVPSPWDTHFEPAAPRYSNGSAILYFPRELIEPMRNAFDNALRYLDYCVGRILSALDRKGMLDDTILVITGDHGEGFMEHGLARHGVHLYEEFVHVPLIFVDPDRPEAKVIGGTVSQLDIAPTIVGAVGLPAHPSWQGENILADHYDGAGRPVFTLLQLTRWQEGAYLDDIKYIYDLSACTDLLFDLRTDPHEQADLSISRPRLRERMRTLLGHWHTRQLRYYSEVNRPFTHYIGALSRRSDMGTDFKPAFDAGDVSP